MGLRAGTLEPLQRVNTMRCLPLLSLLALGACAMAPTGFPHDTPLGTPITPTVDTYGGYVIQAAEQAKSYAEQGDQEALGELLTGYAPDAIEAPMGSEWVFAGCLYECQVVKARKQGDSQEWRFDAKDLAVDGR